MNGVQDKTDNSSATDEIGRRYQIALVEMAKQENCIICLPTGSGKTYIALQLVKHYLADAVVSNKKIAFLANTVPLVHQQATYLRKQLFLEPDTKESHITELTGDLNVDVWKESKWAEVTRKTKVFVMTSQILLDAIRRGYLAFKQINLLIFDECHHADKDHPMAKIMEDFGKIKRKVSGYELPRILGLTATIIKGNLKRPVEDEVKDIEKMMQCRAVTYHDYEEVLEHSTKADVKLEVFRPTSFERKVLPSIVRYLDETISCISELKESFRLDMRSTIAGIGHSSLTSHKQMYKQPKFFMDDQLKALTDVKKIFEEENVGLYGGKLAAVLKRGFLQVMAAENNRAARFIQIAADTCLARVIAECDDIMASYEDINPIVDFCSSKTQLLFNILYDWQQTHGEQEELCGIVFCTERLTAQILTWVFMDAIEKNGDKYKFIKPAFVVGNSRVYNDLEEQRVTTRKQEATIKRFHRKEVNLLFATCVLEEGLNVPGCNVVIRFDPIQKYPSYVQSMGRARKRGALFCVLCSAKTEMPNEKMIGNFTQFNTDLANYLKDNAMHIDEDDVDHCQPATEDEYTLAIDSSNPDSPKITLTDAVQLVHRYCQLLSCDRFINMEPVAWWKEVATKDGQKHFKAYVQLPLNAIFREIVKGSPMPTKNEAKRIAFFNVCKRLYEHDALDERLVPRRRVLPEKLTTFLYNAEQQDNVNKLDKKEKHAQWYPKMIPKFLDDSELKADKEVDVYMIKLSLLESTSDSIEHQKLYNFESKRHTLAVLCETNLNDIPPGYLYAKHGVLESKFEKVALKGGSYLNHEKILEIKKFQELIFSKILKLEHKLMIPVEVDQILIMALNLDANGDWDYDWELLKKLENDRDGVYRTEISESDRASSLSMDKFEDAVVIPWNNNNHVLEMCCVCSVQSDLTPDSPLKPMDPSSKSIASHYAEKSKSLRIMNPHMPFLAVASLGNTLNFLNLKKDQSQLDAEKLKDIKNLHSIKILIPEFVRIHPMPASIYTQISFLPSILQRMNRLLLAREIMVSVAKQFNWKCALECTVGRGEPALGSPQPQAAEVMNAKTNSDKWSCGTSHARSDEFIKESDNTVDLTHLDYVHPNKISDSLIASHRSWKSVQKWQQIRSSAYSENKVQLQHLINSLLKISDIKFPSLDLPTNFTVVTGPTADAVMEALTLAKAQEAFSLENLEVIGDSFLKFCVTSHIFTEFPEHDEGFMSQLRTKLISNRHLYVAGTKKNLGDYLSGGVFIPETSWLPPGKCVPNAVSLAAIQLEKNYDIFDNIEDDLQKICVTELVNKVTKSGDVNLCHSPKHTTFTHTRLGDKKIADCVEALIGVYYMNAGIDGALRFMEWLGLRAPVSTGEIINYKRPIPTNRVTNIPTNSKITSPLQLLPMMDELEALIQYRFNDKWLVVEAFTHPGYLKNTITNCYQRLEFLGDAVLDFLVTNHIYNFKLAKTPGALTDLRSALVNNVTFGSIAVRYGFQKFLLSISKQLQDGIDTFVTYQEDNNHAVTGHFSLLNDSETPCAQEVEVPKVLGDLFESIAGAVYLDSGMSLDLTWKIFYRLMKSDIDSFAVSTPIAPVRELHERIKGVQFKSLTDVNSQDDPYRQFSVASVKVDGKDCVGFGASKKQAKQAAAKIALRMLNQK